MTRQTAKCVLAVLIGTILLAQGCQRGPVRRVAKFSEAEFAPYDKEGTGTITGQAFVRTVGGDVKYAAGLSIFLVPVTSYTTEWFKKTVRDGITLSAEDPRFAKYQRQTVGDGQGKFKFDKVPEGQYYIASRISWMYQNQLGLLSRTVDWATAKVDLGNGATMEIVASNN